MFPVANFYEDCNNINDIENHLKYLFKIREKSLDKIIRFVLKYTDLLIDLNQVLFKLIVGLMLVFRESNCMKPCSYIKYLQSQVFFYQYRVNQKIWEFCFGPYCDNLYQF